MCLYKGSCLCNDVDICYFKSTAIENKLFGSINDAKDTRICISMSQLHDFLWSPMLHSHLYHLLILNIRIINADEIIASWEFKLWSVLFSLHIYSSRNCCSCIQNELPLTRPWRCRTILVFVLVWSRALNIKVLSFEKNKTHIVIRD